jgi:hypothetical protein
MVARIYAQYERDPMRQLELTAEEKLHQNPRTPEGALIDDPDKEVRERAAKARNRLAMQLKLPAALVRDEKPELFSEADRTKAESELRLAVVPPLGVIAVFLSYNQSCWWELALIPVVVLLWQGHTRNLRFRSLMSGAVEVSKLRSESYEDFKGGSAAFLRHYLSRRSTKTAPTAPAPLASSPR